MRVPAGSSFNAFLPLSFPPYACKREHLTVPGLRAAWLAYDVKADGTVTNGRVFIDAPRWRQDPFVGPDGFKVGRQGTFWAHDRAG